MQATSTTGSRNLGTGSREPVEDGRGIASLAYAPPKS